MLYLIVVWTALTFVCFTIGIALLNALKVECFERRGDRFIVAVWLGIATLCFLLLSASLIIPLSSLFGGALAVGLTIICLLSPQTRTALAAFWSQKSSLEIFGFFGLALAIAALSAQPVTWIDTGLYHYGAIRWLGEYGAVPGVALIHDRFAFTSSWFALGAPFNASWFGDRNSTLLNGFVFFLACFHLIISLTYASKKQAKLSDLFNICWLVLLISLLIVYPWMSDVRVSPSPDIPVHLMTGLIPWTFLVISTHQPKNSQSFNAWLIPLFLAAIAVTIKIMAAPLLIVAYFNYLLQGRIKISKVILGSFLAFFLLLPMFTFGVIASGCPLYPKTTLCFDVPWLIPAQEAVRTAGMTTRWGDWYGDSPSNQNDWLWISKQLLSWFKYSISNQFMAFSAVCSSIFSVIILKNTKDKKAFQGYFLVIATGIVGILFILTQAPTIRLGLGYFLVIPALFFAFLIEKLSENKFKWFSAFVSPLLFSKLALLIPIFLISLGLVIQIWGQKPTDVLLPPEIKQVSLTSDRINNLEYFYPKDYNIEVCWGAKLPCALGPLKRDIQLREPQKGIRGGFVFVDKSSKL
jgi:hypothetical protein